jgi:hypothetical protein
LVGLAAVAFMGFLLLQPKVKALIAYVLMMQFFDAAPSQLFGMYVWDYGAILMLVLACEVFLRKPVMKQPDQGYLVALKIFLAWMLICFLWSLLVYRYPFVHTLKNARYMMLGYFMTLVFIRLFVVQPGSFEFLMKWFYRLTFVLMPVVAIQYLLNKPLLFGQVSEYEGAIRALPVFLPFCLLNLWIILAKLLTSGRLALHECIYAVLVLVTVALSYTRGIYIGVIFTALLLVWTLARDRTLKASSMFNLVLAGVLTLVVLVASGVASKVGGRAVSGLQLLGSGDTSSSHVKDDTFSGRLGLAAERFSLSWARNPLVGYGFIHEDDVPEDLRNSLKYGTALGGTAADPTAFSRFYEGGHYMLGLYTADIAWADIVICTGWVGVLLFGAMVLTFSIERFASRNQVHPMGYAVRTALFLQLAMMFLLMFDGNSFYSVMHIPAFLLAGYSLTRDGRDAANTNPILAIRQARPANLMA